MISGGGRTRRGVSAARRFRRSRPPRHRWMPSTRYDATVNAFVLVDPEGALAAAKESEARWHAGEPLGPGDGVPTSIKDALWTRGWPTLRGSALIDAAGPWDEDAPCVARLRETGAVILGKTTTPEYSWKGVTDSPRYGADRQPVGPHQDIRRIQRRQRNRRRPRHGAVVGRYRRRRVGAHPCGVHRNGRAEADVRLDPVLSAEPVRDAVARRDR